MKETLSELEWMYQPTCIGELLARLMGPQYMWNLVKYAEERGYDDKAEIARYIALREEKYLSKKEQLNEN